MLDKFYGRSTKMLRAKGMEDLVRVYVDLEKTLKGIREVAGESAHPINIRKLVEQLSRSKKRIERKINNRLLLEKQSLRKKIKRLASSI